MIAEIIGTIAFALSGADLAMSRRMDLFGVLMLGLITATGGGVIRDLVIGSMPPAVFFNVHNIVIALISALILFLPHFRKKAEIHEKHGMYEKVLFTADTIGLAMFTVVGVDAGLSEFPDQTTLLVFLGVITGVGGGILRDMLAGMIPYVFTRHFYACASLIGAYTYVLLIPHIGKMMSYNFAIALIILLRVLAAKYRWNLPK